MTPTVINPLVDYVLALEHDDESCRYLRGFIAAIDGARASRTQVHNTLHLLRVYGDPIWDDVAFESGVGMLPMESIVERMLVELSRRYREYHGITE